MAPTPIPGGNRFSPRGVRKVYALPAVAAATLIPTRAEINAGTDLTPQISSMGGFAESANFVETPDLVSQFNGKIVDGVSAEDPTVGFYGSKDGADASDFFDRGQTWFIVVCNYGDAAGRPADVFPTEVGSVAPPLEMSGAFNINVAFSITDEPARRVALPA